MRYNDEKILGRDPEWSRKVKGGGPTAGKFFQSRSCWDLNENLGVEAGGT